jgi:beta-lactamase regulating signal transducer with metallopeptidase domain
MFAVRGIAVSFSIFVLLYGALSLAVCGLWRGVWHNRQNYSARRCANLLFALRMAPFIIAIGATIVLAVPSFLLLEPRAVTESMSSVPAVLSVCGIAVVLAAAWNAGWALVRASRVVAGWSREAGEAGSGSVDSGSIESPIEPPIQSMSSVSVLRLSAGAPPLTVAGIFHPSIWLSSAAEFVLSQRELQSALRHEVVHVRRRDNLRKLMLCLVAFPGTADLENAWREATEMAADDAAVSSASEALDLAAALIKLSRLASVESQAELTTALVHSPAELVNARVERLIAWSERPPAKRSSSGYALCVVAVVTATLALSYPQLLAEIHTATEWLVR